MGRKGTSKRKPKGSKSFSKNKGQNSGENKIASVQDLVKGKDAPQNTVNADGNKKHKKGK